MKDLFNKLNLYDFLGYLIPGGLVLVFLNMFFQVFLSTDFIFEITTGGALEATLFIIISYFIGILMHELSQILQECFLKKLWGGFPSERFLLYNDNKYSDEYKQKIKKMIKAEFDIDLNNTKDKNQEAFKQIYSTVQKLDGKNKIQLFNTIYGMCRNLFAGVTVGLIFFLIKFLAELRISNFRVNITYLILFFIASCLLYRRTKRFSERFADYVYRDFYNYCKQKEDN